MIWAAGQRRSRYNYFSQFAEGVSTGFLNNSVRPTENGRPRCPIRNETEKNMAEAPTPWHEPASRKQKSNRKNRRRIGEYPARLRGMATNRYGGNKLQHERGLRGGTYGPASAVRVYTDEQRNQYERDLRQRGEIE